MVSDAVFGIVLYYGSIAFYVYYLLWVIITPFINLTHPWMDYFPPMEYSYLPHAFLVSFLVLLTTTVAVLANMRECIDIHYAARIPTRVSKLAV
mmetsp:Transcript_28365/g.39319  ORF Transcript_28365/g.39319 Transcript_28365/m.39319 type:complete len:94 (+) Transcript_28365:93-374(+)